MPGLSLLFPVSSIACGVELMGHWYLVDWSRDEGFWGLTGKTGIRAKGLTCNGRGKCRSFDCDSRDKDARAFAQDDTVFA